MLPELKRYSLVKPTLHTKFHIDYDWWRQNDRSWRIYLTSLLCPSHQAAFQNKVEGVAVDWVDPETAEVQRVDGLQHILISHCAKQSDFITPYTPLVDAAFRLFLANGNTPLTPIDMGMQLGRPPEIILRTLSSPTVYRGVRPCPEC